MILAPNEMKSEPDERKASKLCLETIKLDPDWYRIGHTKARNLWAPTHYPTFSNGKSKNKTKKIFDRLGSDGRESKAVFKSPLQLLYYLEIKSDPVNRNGWMTNLDHGRR